MDNPQKRWVPFTAPGLFIGALAVGAAGGMTIYDGPAEVLALIEKPLLLVLIAVLFVGVFAGMAVEQFRSKMRRQAWQAKNRSRWEEKRRGASIAIGPWSPMPVPEPPKKPDAADQLRIVMGATFTIQPLLNKSEARVFKEVDRIVIGCNPTW